MGKLCVNEIFWKTGILRRSSLLRMTKRYNIIILGADEESGVIQKFPFMGEGRRVEGANGSIVDLGLL